MWTLQMFVKKCVFEITKGKTQYIMPKCIKLQQSYVYLLFNKYSNAWWEPSFVKVNI